MEEYRENNNDKSCNCTNHNSGHWIKFALLLLALFLASYLAVYYILDQMRHAYYIPSAPVENIDRIIKEQGSYGYDTNVLHLSKFNNFPLAPSELNFKGGDGAVIITW